MTANDFSHAVEQRCQQVDELIADLIGGLFRLGGILDYHLAGTFLFGSLRLGGFLGLSHFGLLLLFKLFLGGGGRVVSD